MEIWARVFKSMILVIALLLLKQGFVEAQSVKADMNNLGSRISKLDNYSSAKLGTDDKVFYGMHGITYKLTFDPDAIYPDSIQVSVNAETLGLKANEIYEIQRVDSCYLLYSLTVKGKHKSFFLDELPIQVEFKVKPSIEYELIANNCKYTLNFKAESVKAYDQMKYEIALDPFVLPVDIECEGQGERNLLIAAPNPTKERCWVYIEPGMEEEIEMMILFDMKGEQIDAKIKSYDNQIELDLSSLRPGHYYLNIIYSDHKKDVVKIAKV